MTRLLLVVLLLIGSWTTAQAGVCDDEEDAQEALADASEIVRAAEGPEGLGNVKETRSLARAQAALTGLSSCEGQLGRRALYWRAYGDALVGNLDDSRASLEALWRRKPPKAERSQVTKLRKRVEEAAETQALAQRRRGGRTAGLGVGGLLAAGVGSALTVLAVVNSRDATTWDALAAGTADSKDVSLYEDQSVGARRKGTAFGIGGGALLATAGALGIASVVSAAGPSKVAVGIAPAPGGVAVALFLTW